jgi:DNA-binding PadR family transcriptional regulator
MELGVRNRPQAAHLVMLVYKIGMTHEPLGELEQMVLLAIVRLGRDSYGTPIVDELARHTRRPILRPSVYLALKRLEAKGLIRSRLGEPEARRGGRARRHFEPAAAGLKALRESQRTLNSLWNGVVLADSHKKNG